MTSYKYRITSNKQPVTCNPLSDPDMLLTGGVVHVPIPIRMANIGVLLTIGDLATALTAVDELLGYLERVQLPVYRPEALYLQGRILQQQGNPSTARRIWQQARTESEAMGERRMRWQILAGLTEVAEDADDATELLQSAREIVAAIADNAGRLEHRRSFLGRPDVQHLLSAN